MTIVRSCTTSSTTGLSSQGRTRGLRYCFAIQTLITVVNGLHHFRGPRNGSEKLQLRQSALQNVDLRLPDSGQISETKCALCGISGRRISQRRPEENIANPEI